MASVWVEHYKVTQKTTTQKSKAVRKTLFYSVILCILNVLFCFVCAISCSDDSRCMVQGALQWLPPRMRRDNQC